MRNGKRTICGRNFFREHGGAGGKADAAGCACGCVDSLLLEERELAIKVLGEEMPLADYADMKGKNPQTLSDHKRKVLSKLRKFSWSMGLRLTADDHIRFHPQKIKKVSLRQ